MKRFVFLLVIGLSGVFLTQSVMAHSPFFDFFKNIKATPVQTARRAPFFPWWHPQPFETPQKRLATQNTAFRTQWQPEPVYSNYRPNSWFNASVFHKKMQDRLKNPIKDTSTPEEKIEYENCSIKGSVLSYDKLPKKEFTNRCCECNTVTGKFECEYQNYNASNQQICSMKDLEITFGQISEDTSFSKPTQKRFGFDFTIKNHATRYSFSNIDIELLLGEKSLQKISLIKGLAPLEEKKMQHTIFSNFPYGVIISAENKDPLRLIISSDQEEPNMEKNNESKELIVFNTPKADLAISAFSIQKQSGQNIQILAEIQNKGPLESLPANGKLHLFINDNKTPLTQIDIQTLRPGQTITKSHTYTLTENSALFSGKIIPEKPDNDTNLTNNAFEQFFKF